MEPSLAHGFHAEFQRIQNAMKKSLFKRVDYVGSCSELLELGAALRREGSAPNAAMCLLAAAQCQKALENATAAAHCEAQAGQLLSQDLHLAAAGVDDATFELLLPDAARCYLGAINIYLEHEHWSLAGNLYAELAGLMSDFGHLMDASLYYEKAAHLMEVDRALAMAETLLDRALRCRIQSRDYDGAIQNTSNTLVLLHRRLSKSNVIGLEGGNLQGLYSRIAHAQVTKVLLLALAQKYAEGVCHPCLSLLLLCA